MTFALIAKEERVLQNKTDRTNDIETWYGMENNVDKTKGKRIWRQADSVSILPLNSNLDRQIFFYSCGISDYNFQ